MVNSPVDATSFLHELTSKQLKVVRALKKLVRQTAPTAVETVLWRSLSYHRPSLGGRVKGAVCFITPKGGAVHLGFVHGASLPDPHGLLKGNAKAKRYLVIRSLQNIDRAALIELIKAAAQYDPSNPQ